MVISEPLYKNEDFDDSCWDADDDNLALEDIKNRKELAGGVNAFCLK